MATWYRVWYSFNEIIDVEVVRETKEFISTTEHGARGRESKISGWRSYFPTWDDAYADLMAYHAKEIARSRKSLDLALSKQGEANSLKPPSEQKAD